MGLSYHVHAENPRSFDRLMNIYFVRRFFKMEYRGIEFVIGIHRTWQVEMVCCCSRPCYRSGLACSREAAAVDARKAISWLLAAKSGKLKTYSADAGLFRS
jgi:hypothetical protein